MLKIILLISFSFSLTVISWLVNSAVPKYLQLRVKMVYTKLLEDATLTQQKYFNFIYCDLLKLLVPLLFCISLF